MQDYVHWKREEEDYKASNSKKHSAHPGTSTRAYQVDHPALQAPTTSQTPQQNNRQTPQPETHLHLGYQGWHF